MNAIHKGAAPGRSVVDLQLTLLKMWSGYQFSRALHVAAELNIADLLAGGSQSVKALARSTGTHEPSLYRLLRALASRKVFRELEDSVFTQTELSELLRSDHPDSVRDTVGMTDGAWWNSFGDLEFSIRTGHPSFEKCTQEDYFSYHESHPEVSQQFERGMANYANLLNPILASSYDFADVQSVCDIGGGKGAFLAEVLKRNTHLRGTLLDRASVVTNASHLSRAGVDKRVERIGGDFFRTVPEGSDAYFLQHILHDWSDQDCLKLLKVVRNAVRPGARLLVLDIIVPPANEPHPGKITDLLMLVLLGGKERTLEEFTELLNTAGFSIEKVISTDTPLSIIDAR